ncbi:MAG: transport permease protein [Candidatus Nitrosocaldaceae archaeon]|nr:MAG: transport permease protein [Candidatus Nitrosocaldaceae archaeon]
MEKIIRLVRRNFTATIDKPFMIWQVFFPMIYIFVAGYAYTAVIDEVNLPNADITYPAFIASGMIGFNIMNSSITAGTIIWNDKRNGMFEQILMGPFTRMHYIASNIITIIVMGMLSASIIIAVSIFTVFNGLNISILSIPFVAFSIILGSIFFGSIAIITSIKLRTSEGFQVILNTTFLFFAFVSTTFYPSEGAPEPLKAAFSINPLTYVVDIIRAGLFNISYPFLYIEMALLTLVSIIVFFIATYLLTRLDV